MQKIYVERYPNLFDRLEDDPEQLGGYLGVAKDDDGYFKRWAVVFINFHTSKFGFEFKVKGHDEEQISDIVDKKEILSISGFPIERLMAQPELKFSIAKLPTTGKAEYHSKNIKIRKKHLIKEGMYNAQLDLNLIPIFEFPWPVKKSKESLKEHTEQLSKNRPEPSTPKKVSLHDPRRKAGFSDKLDLHAWAIVDEPADYTAGELFILQLKALDAYLDEAIQVGFEKVTIIHGVGKGRLKDEVFRRLRQHPHIRDFKNEYHQDHKFGATEVYFK